MPTFREIPTKTSPGKSSTSINFKGTNPAKPIVAPSSKLLAEPSINQQRKIIKSMIEFTVLEMKIRIISVISSFKYTKILKSIIILKTMKFKPVKELMILTN